MIVVQDSGVIVQVIHNDLRTGWREYWRALSGGYGLRYWLGFVLAASVSAFVGTLLTGLARAAWTVIR